MLKKRLSDCKNEVQFLTKIRFLRYKTFFFHMKSRGIWNCTKKEGRKLWKNTPKMFAKKHISLSFFSLRSILTISYLIDIYWWFFCLPPLHIPALSSYILIPYSFTFMWLFFLAFFAVLMSLRCLVSRHV